VFVKIGPHVYNFGLLVHAELDARVEDQNESVPAHPSVAGGRRAPRVDGVVLTFAAPIGLGLTSPRLELQGAEAEAARELFNTLRRIFDGQPLRVGDVVEVRLPQPDGTARTPQDMRQ
jgi:hypothetical protein